jgi:hypothetical protein
MASDRIPPRSLTLAAAGIASAAAAAFALTVFDRPDESPPRLPMDQLEATCGDLVLPGGPDPVLPDQPLDHDAASALQAAWEVGADPAVYAGYEWFIAQEADDRLDLFGVPPDRGEPVGVTYAHASFRRLPDGWEPHDVGQCRISLSLPGHSSGPWVLDPAHEPSPSDTAIQVLFTDPADACGDDVPPATLAVASEMNEETITVVINIEMDRPPLFCNAVGVPPRPLTISLGEPIGERALFDGSLLPPRHRPWPPSAASLDDARHE